MNSVVTKDSRVTTENGKNTTQVSRDKCFYVATKFSAWSQLKEEFLSQQRKSCRDIALRIHNKEQKISLSRQRLFISRQKKHEVEVNSITTRNSLSLHRSERAI